MAVIFYALAGEGRGHATRACTIVESLRHEHRVVLFAPEHAYEMLSERYAGSDVEVEEIEGLCFRYDARGRMAKFATAKAALGYLWRLPRLLKRLGRRIERDRPAIVLTDFDPALPRAARRAGIPYLSVDHQHFLLVSDLSDLPLRQRVWAAFMGLVVKAYYCRQAKTVCSSFYFPKLKPKYADTVQTGVLLRPELLQATPEHGDHLCVYLRRHASEALLQALRDLDVEARIYGIGERPRDGKLWFREIAEQTFVEDLRTCAGLVSTAGNQLVGEALWLEKPVFGMPEPGNEEQTINGHFIEQSGAGMACSFDDVSVEDLRKFLDGLDKFRSRIDRKRLNGNDPTLRTIQEAIAAREAVHAA